jgi:hypothetical protein
MVWMKFRLVLGRRMEEALKCWCFYNTSRVRMDTPCERAKQHRTVEVAVRASSMQPHFPFLLLMCLEQMGRPVEVAF